MSKNIGILIALVVVAGAGFYFMAPASQPGAIPLTTTQDSSTADTRQSAGTAAPVAQPTDSVDAFAAGIEAEMSASESAVKTMDAQTDASVSAIQTTGDSSKLYDPSNL